MAVPHGGGRGAGTINIHATDIYKVKWTEDLISGIGEEVWISVADKENPTIFWERKRRGQIESTRCWVLLLPMHNVCQ